MCTVTTQSKLHATLSIDALCTIVLDIMALVNLLLIPARFSMPTIPIGLAKNTLESLVLALKLYILDDQAS